MTTVVQSSAVDSQQKPLELNEPNATLYISNIDWKIKKAVLRRALWTLFSRHGKILEIITLRSERLRGQAWVIFQQVTAATAALNAEQGFCFFGRDLKVAYAREKSDRISKLDGTYVAKDRRQKRREIESADDETSPNKKTRIVTDYNESKASMEGASIDVQGISKYDENTTSNSGGAKSVSSNSSPSNILFAESLPVECNEMMLAMLFRQYTGFKEVRIPRPGLAFIEFDDEPHATIALKSLNGLKITATDTLELKYGKS